MARIDLEWVDVVSQLIELTQDGDLIWEVGDPFPTVGNDNSERIESVFTANYEGKKLRIYKRIYQALGRFPRFTYLTEQVVLEMIDNNGLTLWAFPQVPIMHDLLDAVRYEVAGINNFLDDILSPLPEYANRRLAHS